MGGLFIAVVMFFPNGLAGLWETLRERIAIARQRRRTLQRVTADETLVAPEIEASGKLANTGGE
jgi:hypothetical protein